MKTRQLGPFDVSAIGFGCMSLSPAYGPAPPEDEAVALLHRTLDRGYTFFDTASVYGMGNNEKIVGRALKDRRDEIILATKAGLGPDAEGQRVVNGRPDFIRWSCEQSLKRLGVEIIDLFYLHRWDRSVPIAESVGAMAQLVAEGKVREIGLSEVSAETLRRGHEEFPITAIQSEYSLWTRNPEVAVLEACKDLGVAFVAFGAVGRGFLTQAPPKPGALVPGDIRLAVPRFNGEAYLTNLKLLDEFYSIAAHQKCTPAQLALAWTLHQAKFVIPIPGTNKPAHMEENAEADQIELGADALERLDLLINAHTVVGGRYNDVLQAMVDTEEVPPLER